MGNEQGNLGLSEEELKKRAISRMDYEMKRKLGKGTQYNLRIVIRGDKGTGKSSLWKRLQGKSFDTTHEPSTGIQICHINWNYRVTDELVKVEVWDVVDKAPPKPENAKDNSTATPAVPRDISTVKSGAYQVMSLDASTVDVLKDTNGIIFTCDPSRSYTWDYVKREVPNVPKHITVLVLANFRDQGWENAQITTEEMLEFCKDQGPHVNFLEASMLNCFGLKGVQTFINLPFLRMKRAIIEEALSLNTEELNSVISELTLVTESQDYTGYVAILNRRQQAIPRTGSSDNVSPTASPPTSPKGVRKSKPSEDVIRTPSNSNVSAPPPASPVASPSKTRNSTTGRTKGDEVVESLKKLAEESKVVPKNNNTTIVTEGTTQQAGVEEFVPEGDDVDDFFSDESTTSRTKQSPVKADVPSPLQSFLGFIDQTIYNAPQPARAPESKQKIQYVENTAGNQVVEEEVNPLVADDDDQAITLDTYNFSKPTTYNPPPKTSSATDPTTTTQSDNKAPVPSSSQNDTKTIPTAPTLTQVPLSSQISGPNAISKQSSTTSSDNPKSISTSTDKTVKPTQPESPIKTMTTSTGRTSPVKSGSAVASSIAYDNDWEEEEEYEEEVSEIQPFRNSVPEDDGWDFLPKDDFGTSDDSLVLKINTYPTPSQSAQAQQSTATRGDGRGTRRPAGRRGTRGRGAPRGRRPRGAPKTRGQ